MSDVYQENLTEEEFADLIKAVRAHAMTPSEIAERDKFVREHGFMALPVGVPLSSKSKQ